MWAIHSAWAANKNNPIKIPYNIPTIVTTITSQAMVETIKATPKYLFSEGVLSSTAFAILFSLLI
jgi:hypothetical protein